MEILDKCPTEIRNKIILYYLGFGTPGANVLKPMIKTIQDIKQCASICTDDYTLWRYKIMKLQSGFIEMQITTHSGYISLCELTIAYNESESCNTITSIKTRQIEEAKTVISLFGLVWTMI